MTIAAAERIIGVTFPDDLTASLLRHDGSGTGPNSRGQLALPGNYGLIPVETILNNWTMLKKILDDLNDPETVGRWFHPDLLRRRIPFLGRASGRDGRRPGQHHDCEFHNGRC